MASPELFLVTALKVMVEVAGYTLLGQGVLFVLAGQKRHNNIVYRLLAIVVSPAIRVTRALTPRFILDQHIPLVTFFLLLWIWVGLVFAKGYICVSQGLNCTG